MKHFFSFFLMVFVTASTHVFAQTKVVMKSAFTDTVQKKIVPFPEYPPLQMQRDNWMNLNGKWNYVGGKNVLDLTTATKPPSFDKAEKITVPYPPESYLSGIQRKQEINMWYKRTFTLPSSYEGKHVLLNLGASDYQTVVFMNNKKASTPLICTEYMARTRGSLFATIMPLLKKNNVGAINWGLVSGKTNTTYAWNTPIQNGTEPKVWFHDIFRKDGTPFSEKEIQLIKSLTAAKN